MNKTVNTRCVVTGLGLISAIGNDVNECWENALAGKSGIKKVTSVDDTNCYANLGAEVSCDTLDVDDLSKEVDRVSKLCLKASREAMKDAAYEIAADEASRVGVIMGSCVGGVVSIENYVTKGGKTEDINRMSISQIATHVANAVGAKGVITNVGNACAAGTISIAYACELIRAGVADAFIVGGADAFASVPYSGFLALHALSENPCSPFNHSNGITLGEGSGALVVESYEHAMKRGAKIYCDVLSAGISSDAHHITAPRTDGVGQMYAIRTAIKNSGITPADIDYINAHGTGTGKNDQAEFLSLHTIFDEETDKLSVSSTKAMVGHCLGAAGAIEAVFAVKALTENKIPPTVGYTEEDLAALPEKAGKIDFMPNEMKEKELNYVMSNSFAFGGSNASIIFSKKPGDVKETETDEKIYVTGMGIVSPLGNGVANYIEKATSGASMETASGIANVGKEDYDKFDVKMAFYRKLDKFSLMQVISGLEAMQSAGIEVTEDNTESLGMIVGTGDGPITTVYEFQEAISAQGNANGSAFNFPNTVYNAAGGYLSIKNGMRGYNVTVTSGAQAGLSAVCYAYNELKQNRASAMMASGTDENSEVMTKLYNQLGLTTDAKKSAYDGGNGFNLSDGSTTIVLEKESYAKEHGAKLYAEVAGYGMAHANIGIGDLAGSEEALVSAMNQALEAAGVKASDIDCVFGFANGNAMVDDMEKKGLAALFEDMPVIEVKDIVGEARAAAATLSAGHAALTLAGELGTSQKGYVFKNDATIEKATINTENFKNVLAIAYAQGGTYSAVVLKKAE
ncbi:MAG: beta-ketoacyl-[acyl-carrier-protein] synthase family protein [Lachnospiraceae bacterium]|nr:beta-ketoacyl-[acyl-carrier-protein] synthase family protein [Lachnospiraceae bacterium]